MAEKRVHEIAKERGMSASDALLKLRAAGIDVTAAASVVDEAEALRALGANGAATAAPPRPAAGQQRPGSGPPAQRAAGSGAPAQRPGQQAQRPAQPGARAGQPAQPGQRPAQGQQQRAPRRVFEPDGPPLKVTPRSQREPERPRPVLPPRPPAGAGRSSQQSGRPAQGGRPQQRPAQQQRPAAEQQRPAAQQAPAQPQAAPAQAQQPQARQAAPAAPEQQQPKAAPAQPQQQQPKAAPAPAAPAPAAPAQQPPQPRAAPAEQQQPAAAPAQAQPAPAQQAPAQPAQAQPAAPAQPQAQAAAPAAPTAAAGTQEPAAQAKPADAPAARQEGAQNRRRGTGPRVIAPTEGTPAPGTGPKIISAPEPEKRPTRDETQSKPSQPGGRPNRGGLRNERAPGGGTRRVVIDSQASRRGPGAGPGGGGPGGGPGGPQQRPRRRGRRRRDVLAETAAPLDQQAAFRTDVVRINSGSTVKDVAEYLGVPVPEIIKQLMMMGEMVTLTQTLSDEAIGVLAEALEKEVEVVHADDAADDEPAFEDADEDLVQRPPVVTIMGHVDHGKTSLLDAIRQTNVVKGEAGGITQHIGAYQVSHDGRTITFLDTPGHEAFTAMRARGAQVTDIAVIVVAADDGVMPQTREAIDHAKAAGVPILVAVNKIDKEGAQPDRVRTEMTNLGLQPEEWGGETMFVDVSAKTKQNLDDLLESIILLSEVEELKANPDTEASGVVVESKLDPGRGAVVTILVQRGTLKVGDNVVAGAHWGRVRAMHDYKGCLLYTSPSPRDS